VRQRNARREKNKQAPLSAEEEKQEVEKEMYLMIKADEKAFYGRILQVVNMARDTASDVKNFAFVSLPESAQEVVLKQKRQGTP
jgi:biopolymer transport protein ExbD